MRLHISAIGGSMIAAMSFLIDGIREEMETSSDERATHSVSTKDPLPLVLKGYSSSSNDFGHRGLDFLRK